MNIIQWIKDNVFTSVEMDTEESGYVAPSHRECHNTLLYKYCERYLNSLNPNHNYDVREVLKSGMIITHITDVSLQEAKDYCRRIWISSVPPNLVVEVTTSW